jgi:transcriptional regulator with XRE-family HTH domain
VPAILVAFEGNNMVDKQKESERLAKRLGKNVAERRKQLEWTQEQVAERVGVDAETISRFERGANLPSLLTLEKLSTALRLPVGDLLSKQRPEAATEGAIFDVLIADLSSSDRAFVMTVARNCCDYLGNRAK